jgi:hypothetical protein
MRLLFDIEDTHISYDVDTIFTIPEDGYYLIDNAGIKRLYKLGDTITKETK